MPRAAPRPCSQCGCRALVTDGTGRCTEHQRERWVKVVPVKRITGRRLQAMRASLFARQPLCVLCLEQGRATAANQRDHTIALADGGLDDETNEQALCTDCHDAKSLGERQRAGRRR